MALVTESLEDRNITTGPSSVRIENRPNRLHQALAWVGIVAGSLFIIATVFFSGYVLGSQSHGGGGHHGPHRVMLKPPPPGPDGPMMGPDGPMGPGMREGPAASPSAVPVTPPRP